MWLDKIEKKLAKFDGQFDVKTLTHIKRGIEKESLRITPDGRLSIQPHPRDLGSALTNPVLTTDYSEALMEFITPPSSSLAEPHNDLKHLHRFVYDHIGDEILWATSMPCVMGDESSIPIAEYGTSNVARMKRIYRIGLGHRYGRFMQVIAGVHFNFSLPAEFWQCLYDKESNGQPFQDFVSEKYMGLIRNFLRFQWLVVYLFGASPAMCESFLRGRKSRLKTLVPGTLYSPYATSLRMSDLGYQNKSQSRLQVSYNSLEEYTSALERAIRTSDPLYEEIGVKNGDDYHQLNANLLQIENEFYSSIRPKQIAESGERPTLALKRRGIEYVEIRALDLNPFSPVGIQQEQMRFLDILLLTCSLLPSPAITAREEGEYLENLQRVVIRGREPDLHLLHRNREKPLKQQVARLFQAMEPVAEWLDSAYGCHEFSAALSNYWDWVEEPELTLSGQLLRMVELREDGFFPFALSLSKQHKDQILSENLSKSVKDKLKRFALESLVKQRQLESDNQVEFADYLNAYYQG